MRFLVGPGRPALDRMHGLVRMFLGFAALLVVATVAQRWAQGELTEDGLVLLFADAEQPGGALRSAIVWEQLHAGAFLYGFLIFTVGSALAVCPVRPAVRGGLILGAGVAALGDLLLPFGAFRLPHWAALRTASFLAVAGIVLVMIVVVWARFGRPSPGDAAQRERQESPDA